MKEQEIKKVCKCEGTIELTPEGRCRKCFGIINYPFKEQELIKRIEKEFVEKTKGKSMSTSDEERLLISISIQQAKSEVSLGKFAVKLVEQGKEIGKSEAVKEIIKKINSFGFTTNSDKNKLIRNQIIELIEELK